MSGRCWTRREALAALSAAALGLALPACDRRAGVTPPEIAFGEDVCDWCRMTIDDPRLAAAFVPASGRSLRFGEAGCLLSWLAENPGAAGSPFVAAREDGGWLLASAATYTRGTVRTPMSFDIAAWRGEPGVGEERLTWKRLREEGAPRASRG